MVILFNKRSSKIMFQKSFSNYRGNKKKFLIPQAATYGEISKKENTKKSLKIGCLGAFKDIKNIKILIEAVLELNLNIHLLLNKKRIFLLVNIDVLISNLWDT